VYKQSYIPAKIGLQLLKIKKLDVVKTNTRGKTDDVIVDYALKEECIVATQDKDLKRRLANQGTKVITLKQKKTLMFVN